MRSLLRVAPGKVVLVTHLEETSLSNLLTEQVANELAWVHIIEPCTTVMTTELKNMLFFAEEVSNLVFDAEGMIVKHRDACMQAFLSPPKYQHEVQVCNVWIRHWPWQVFWFLQV